MRSRFAFFLFAVSSTALTLVAAACGSSKDSPSSLPLIEGGSGRKDGGGSPTNEQDAEVGDTTITPGTPGRIYAHTADTLYLFEPVSNELKFIGKFSCLKAGEFMVDLAVDRTGTVYATTFTRFLTVDPITGSCSDVRPPHGAGEAPYPNALSFVPAGTVDPTMEALVGYAPPVGTDSSTDYVRIDTKTGVMTKIGTLNATGAKPRYKSSGDLISLIQDQSRTFLTVKNDVDGGGGTDSLAEVNPKTGELMKILGPTNQTDIFGLGYWAGKGYGFSDNGKISEIDMSTGSATVVKTLTGDGGVGIPWFGAGVTTEAPITR